MTTDSSMLGGTRRWLAGLLMLAIGPLAFAQSVPGPGLGGVEPSLWDNDIERAAAIANQAVFDLLDESCNPGGVLDNDPDPRVPPDPTACGGDVFAVYISVRQLIHTANELQGSGPTVASLQLGQSELGTALRWTAAEELAAQGSAATDFANNQLSNLASRLNALRFGATGFSVAGIFDPSGNADGLVAGLPRRGGGASADESGAAYSPWGGFLNGSIGSGDRTDTGREDAFDFDGSEITLGIDYRFDNNVVVGGLLGFKQQDIDFDEAANVIRATDGGIDIDGTSLIVFGLYQGEKLFVSGSLGTEQLDYDVERRIIFVSNNPLIGSVNSIARSSPEADVLTATVNVAYAFNKDRLTIEPFFNAEYLDIDIGAFSEQRSTTSTGTIDEDALNLRIGGQSFDSLDATLGVRLQYVYTPEFGVFIPYFSLELHNEVLKEERIISSGYAALSGFPGGDALNFSLPTDRVDETWMSWTVGFSTVLRGARQSAMGGPVGGGLSAFLQFESVEDLANFDQHVISGGFRYEF
ncbi:MAG: autotransporter outer membrane beta-barrel domain-containing protein [Woeseiaceae bacterium]|nr:autotransporter outer membrane beta-barrel domain-containing protein [Woeseiaceae bacterium]